MLRRLRRLRNRIHRLSFCLFKRYTAGCVARELKDSLLTEKWEVSDHSEFRNYGRYGLETEEVHLRRGHVLIRIEVCPIRMFDRLTVYRMEGKQAITQWLPFIRRRCLRSCVRHYLLMEMRRELEFDLRNRLCDTPRSLLPGS
jgi:hypothetical protein